MDLLDGLTWLADTLLTCPLSNYWLIVHWGVFTHLSTAGWNNQLVDWHIYIDVKKDWLNN